MSSKTNRNMMIASKRRDGATFASLAAEYEISVSRVNQIVARQEQNKRIIARRLEAPLRHVTSPYLDAADQSQAEHDTLR